MLGALINYAFNCKGMEGGMFHADFSSRHKFRRIVKGL